MWDLESFNYLIQHQIVLKLLECHPGVVDCRSELKLVCGSRDFYFLEPFKIKGRSGRMWDFESFYFVIQHQIVLKLLECHHGVVDCQSEFKMVCGSRDFYFLEPFKIKGRSGRMWDLESFYYLIQHQIVLKLRECHPGVVDCQSELKLVCGSREFYFLKPFKIKGRSGRMWDLESFYYVIQHQIVFKLREFHYGVLVCQSELKLVCGSRDFYFLEPFKIKGRSGRMWDLESFYFVIQHQIVLKLLECHHGVVDCQSELKLICGSRDFYF